MALEDDADWGDLKQYDIEIERTGLDKMTTKYRISQKPKQPLIEEIQQSIVTNGLPELRALYMGKDPFTYVMSEQEIADFEKGEVKGLEEIDEDLDNPLPWEKEEGKK